MSWYESDLQIFERLSFGSRHVRRYRRRKMKDFHVVHIKSFGEHRGYEIYCNNKPFIRLKDGLGLKRHEAYDLAGKLNS